MIEKIELWLNIIHYCLYKVDYKLHLLSNKINPFVLLGKIPAVRRKLQEQDTDLITVTNKVWDNKRYGFGVMIAGGGLTIFVFLLIWALLIILPSIVNHLIRFSWKPFVLCLSLSYVLCHFFVFRQDRYIKYFKKFDKWSRTEKWKYCLLTLGFIVGVIMLWFYSFRFLAF